MQFRDKGLWDFLLLIVAWHVAPETLLTGRVMRKRQCKVVISFTKVAIVAPALRFLSSGGYTWMLLILRCYEATATPCVPQSSEIGLTLLVVCVMPSINLRTLTAKTKGMILKSDTEKVTVLTKYIYVFAKFYHTFLKRNNFVYWTTVIKFNIHG